VRKDARAFWAALFGLEAAYIGWLGYSGAMARHQWTGASIALGIGVFFVLIAATAGVTLGALIRAFHAQGRKTAARACVALGFLLMIWVGARVDRNLKREAYLDSVRTGALTPERARQLAASGSPDERRALAYNRTCPPEVLAELARSEDWMIRAGAAGNPSTPPAVLDALASDANESVRLYLSYNPARKAK
jgi:hypothetical protein